MLSVSRLRNFYRVSRAKVATHPTVYRPRDVTTYDKLVMAVSAGILERRSILQPKRYGMENYHLLMNDDRYHGDLQRLGDSYPMEYTKSRWLPDRPEGFRKFKHGLVKILRANTLGLKPESLDELLTARSLSLEATNHRLYITLNGSHQTHIYLPF